MSRAKQFIKDYTSGCSNELCAVEDKDGKKVISYHEWLTPEQALAAVEIAKEEVIEKACEWLKENKEHPLIGCEDPCLSGYLTDEFIEEFKKAMEE